VIFLTATSASDLKTTIFVRDASVEDTVDLILLQSQLEKKVLNAKHDVPVSGDLRQAEGNIRTLKCGTFQISNGDAKHLQTVLKTVLKVKDVALDETHQHAGAARYGRYRCSGRKDHRRSRPG